MFSKNFSYESLKVVSELQKKGIGSWDIDFDISNTNYIKG
jgi:hypothetical protein